MVASAWLVVHAASFGALSAPLRSRYPSVEVAAAAAGAGRTRAVTMGGFDVFPYAGGVRPGKQSPRRKIPASIGAPDYALDGRPKARGPMLPWQVEVKNAQEIEGMRAAGRVAREVLDAAGAMVKPGIGSRKRPLPPTPFG